MAIRSNIQDNKTAFSSDIIKLEHQNLEKQINVPANYIEMVDKTRQTLQPCVQLDEETMLVDISGEELAGYFDAHGFEQYTEGDPNVPLDRSCTDEEHEQMRQNSVESRPILDTSFRGF